jgi:hypothetical protein
MAFQKLYISKIFDMMFFVESEDFFAMQSITTIWDFFQNQILGMKWFGYAHKRCAFRDRTGHVIPFGPEALSFSFTMSLKITISYYVF